MKARFKEDMLKEILELTRSINQNQSLPASGGESSVNRLKITRVLEAANQKHRTGSESFGTSHRPGLR